MLISESELQYHQSKIDEYYSIKKYFRDTDRTSFPKTVRILSSILEYDGNRGKYYCGSGAWSLGFYIGKDNRLYSDSSGLYKAHIELIEIN